MPQRLETTPNFGPKKPWIERRGQWGNYKEFFHIEAVITTFTPKEKSCPCKVCETGTLKYAFRTLDLSSNDIRHVHINSIAAYRCDNKECGLVAFVPAVEKELRRLINIAEAQFKHE